MKPLKFGLFAMMVAIGACSTVDRMTIADRLQNLGISRDRAECMARELDDRLNDDQLRRFARFTVELDRAESALQAIGALRQIDEPRIARAVTSSAFSCAIN